MKVNAARERIESAMFLATIMVVLLISKSADNWTLNNSTIVDVYSNTFVWTYTAAVSAPMLAFLLWLKRPLSEFGVTLDNWKQSVIEGTAISCILLLLGILAVTIIATSGGKSLTDYIKFDWLKWETLAYIPHSIIQEFVFRGIVLTFLIHMFREHSLWLPLLLSNLLFSFMHLHLGTAAVAITLFSGFLFSWMFMRHKNILGITVAHIVLGSTGFLFKIL